MGLEVADVLEAAEAATAYGAISLDAPAHGAGRDDPRAEPSAPRRRGYDLVEYGVTLGPRDPGAARAAAVILRLRFQEDMTQSEIAQGMGISQMHVSRMLRQALGRLRAVARARHAHRLDLALGLLRQAGPMMGAMGTSDSAAE